MRDAWIVYVGAIVGAMCVLIGVLAARIARIGRRR